MTTPDSIQSAFLEEVKKRLPLNHTFVDELAEILNISRDSAYRRIRGETILSLDEAKKLCGRFGVSIDSLFAPTTNMIPFMDRSPSANYTLQQWLTSILRNVEPMTEITYAAKDIPIFHYLRHPELAAFKMFFWQKTIIENPDFRTINFKQEEISKEMIQLGRRIWDRYATIPSVEIWAIEAINNTLKQIEFYQECGFFSNQSQGPQLCDHFIDLIQVIQAEAVEGRKEGGGDYNLYQNEILMSDNTIIAKVGGERLAYLNYNTISLLITRQATFCEKTELYLNNLIRHSALISATAEKARIKFFAKLTNRILDFKKTL